MFNFVTFMRNHSKLFKIHEYLESITTANIITYGKNGERL